MQRVIEYRRERSRSRPREMREVVIEEPRGSRRSFGGSDVRRKSVTRYYRD